MDEQIGRVIAALEQKKMLDNTLIIFQSDNDGTHNPMFAGAITDMSKVVLPADNGPYRDGKGSLYQGGTFVVAFASWPGHIKEGSTVNEMIHTVDLYPPLVSTLLAASSARTNRSTAWTCGAPSAKANLPRARRSSTTPSRSARASGGATGSSSNPKRTFSFTQARHGVPPVPSKSGSIGLAAGRQ